jgi:hypothetical protein
MFNTYIDDKDMIPVLLDYDWIVMKGTWTDCPLPTYIGIKKAMQHNNNAVPLVPLAHHTREMM